MYPAPMANLAIDANGVILTDIACRQCGYNLRGLAQAGRCSECGTPVAMSVRADYLRFSNPKWIERVSLGVRILVYMILVGIIYTVVASLLRSGVDHVWTELGELIIAAVSYCGAWLLAEPDPSGQAEPKIVRARKWIRILLAVGLMTPLLSVLDAVPRVPQSFKIALGALGLIGSIANILGEYAKYTLYEHLARRIPDKQLADRAAFLRKAYVGVLCLAVSLGGIFAVLSWVMGSSVSLGIIALIAIPIGLCMIIFGIMTIILLIRLNRSLQFQADSARQSWSTA